MSPTGDVVLYEGLDSMLLQTSSNVTWASLFYLRKNDGCCSAQYFVTPSVGYTTHFIHSVLKYLKGLLPKTHTSGKLLKRNKLSPMLYLKKKKMGIFIDMLIYLNFSKKSGFQSQVMDRVQNLGYLSDNNCNMIASN